MSYVFNLDNILLIGEGDKGKCGIVEDFGRGSEGGKFQWAKDKDEVEDAEIGGYEFWIGLCNIFQGKEEIRNLGWWECKWKSGG